MKFRCTNCNQKIGVPDEAAGKRCKCTKCNEVQNIPTPEPVLDIFDDVALMSEEEGKKIWGQNILLLLLAQLFAILKQESRQ